MSPELMLATARWIGPIIRAVVDEPEILAIRLHYKALELRLDERQAVAALARVIAEDDPGDGGGA
jgi:hypothetical protein